MSIISFSNEDEDDTAFLDSATSNCSDWSPAGTCLVYICRQNCSYLQFPNNSAVYPSIQRALKALPAGLNLTAFLDPTGNFTSKLWVPSNISSLTFIAYKSPNQSIPYDRVRIGQFIGYGTLPLTLTLHHVAWSSPSSTSPGCINGRISNNITLTMLDTEVSCNLKVASTSSITFALNSSLVCASPCVDSSFQVRSGSVSLDAGTYSQPVSIELSQGSVFAATSINFTSDVVLRLDNFSSVSAVNNWFDAGLSVYSSQLDQSKVQFIENTFMAGFRLQGVSIGATIRGNDFFGYNNTFSIRRPMQSLLLSARCIAKLNIQNNYFRNGTVFLEMPAPAETSKSGCEDVRNPFAILGVDGQQSTIIRKNRFALPATTETMWGDILPIPVIPVLSLTASADSPTKEFDSGDERYMVQASQNFWGSGTGPWLCCNPFGNGSFVDQLLNSSDWCVDAACTTTSNVAFEDECLAQGCPQTLSAAEFGTYIALMVLAGIILILVIALVLHQRLRYFTLERMQHEDRAVLIDRACEILRLVSCGAMLAAMGVLAANTMLLVKNRYTSTAPRQRRFQLDGLAVLQSELVVTLVFLICNIVLVVAICIRRRFPKVLDFCVGKIMFIHLFWLIFEFTFAVVFVPVQLATQYSVLGQIRVLGRGDAELTLPTHLYPLLLVLVVPSLFMFLVVYMAGSLVVDLLHHYEYSKITSALEKALMKHLAESEKINRQARFLRYAIIPQFLLAAVFFSCVVYETVDSMKSAYGMNTNEYFLHYPAEAYADLPPAVTAMLLNPLRWLSTAGSSGWILVSLIATITLTFYYQRVAFMTVVLVGTLLGTSGCEYNVIIEGFCFLGTKNPMVFSLKGLTFALSVLLMISTLFMLIFLWRLRRNVINELPKLAVSNLNLHIDDLWLARNTSSDGSYLYSKLANDYDKIQSTGETTEDDFEVVDDHENVPLVKPS